MVPQVLVSLWNLLEVGVEDDLEMEIDEWEGLEGDWRRTLEGVECCGHQEYYLDKVRFVADNID